MDLDALVEERVAHAPLRVPPSPVVALRLGTLVAEDDSTVEALAAVVKQDQSLAAVVLKLANSAHYRRGAEVTSLGVAVVNLGRKSLRDLAWAHTLHEQALTHGPLVALRRRAWRESLVAAQVAQWVAELRGLPADDAFVAGLLHDLGRLPAIGAIESVLAEHPDADTRSEDGWWALVNQHHVALGVDLAKRWQLPHLLADVIAKHHDPASVDPLLSAVRVADDVVTLMDGEPALTAAQLGSIAELDTAHCDELARRLPQLPAYLDAFRGTTHDVGGLRVVDYELRLAAEGTLGLQVSLVVDGLVTDADVLALDERGMVVTRALRPGQLVRVRAGELNVPARVTASVGEDSELAPWALDPVQRDAWLAFVRRSSGSV